MINKKICDNEELVKEVEIMKEISEHPNVIHLIDVYEDANHFNLVLELYVYQIKFYYHKINIFFFFKALPEVNYLIKLLNMNIIQKKMLQT